MKPKGNSTLKIEKGVAIPHGRDGRYSESFHAFMEFCRKSQVGDSALLNGAPSNYRMAAVIARALIEKQFTFSPDGNGVRVWRTK